MNAALTLQETIQIFNPLKQVREGLFPGGARVNRLVRLAQLGAGHLQLVFLKLCGRAVVVIHGKNLVYLNGWVDISIEPKWQTIAGLLAQTAPLLSVAVRRGTTPEVFGCIGIDEDSHLQSFISQNGHVVLRGTVNKIPCIVHYGQAPDSRAAVARQIRGTTTANLSLGGTLAELIPETCRIVTTDHVAIMVQKEIHGLIPPARTLDPAESARVIAAAMAPLRTIYWHSRDQARLSDDEIVDSELSRILDVLPVYRPQIEPALSRLQKWLSDRKPLRIPTHGDYAPRNLFFNSDLTYVVGIIDWEWFWGRGLVGFDALKIVLEVDANRQGKSLIQVLADFLRNSDVDVSNPGPLRTICELYDLSSRDLWHVAMFIWLRVLWMGCVETKPASREWLEEAIMAPAMAIAT